MLSNTDTNTITSPTVPAELHLPSPARMDLSRIWEGEEESECRYSEDDDSNS